MSISRKAKTDRKNNHGIDVPWLGKSLTIVEIFILVGA